MSTRTVPEPAPAPNTNPHARDYIRQLEQLYRGGSWQGESFLDKLSNVDETTAFTPPAAGVHSIAEIAWHAIYWRTVLIKRLQGDNNYREATMEQLSFLPPATLRQKGWAQLQAELEESQNTLIELLTALDDDALQLEYSPGYSYAYHVEGIIHHDVYHLGQIGLVKKILSLH